MGEKNGNKRASAKKKPRKLTPKQEAFTEAYVANGFNGVQAAKAAGYKGSYDTLNAVARENLQKPPIASRVRARIEGFAATKNEVENLLGEHLRGNMAMVAACIVDGDIDWQKAEETGASRLIKRLRCSKRTIPRGGDQAPIIETSIDVELYSSQESAAKLIPVLGMKQKPGENEKDMERRRAYASEQLEMVMNRLGLDREAATEWMRERTPDVAQWIN